MRPTLKSVLTKVLLIIFFIIIIGYSYYKTRDLFRGVNLTIKNIQDGQTVEDPILNVDGSALNSVFLSLNDREIYIDQDGNFEDTVILSPGYNIIVIKSEDKFGKKKEKIFRILYTPTEDSSLPIIETLENNE